MIALITALHAEAKPLLARANLKRELSREPLEVYSGSWNNIPLLLVVSGIGVARAAALTGWVLSHEPTILVNFGCAGARSDLNCGSLFLCDRIIDTITGRAFIPEHLIRPPCALKTLQTSRQPVRSSAELLAPDVALVDMEASAIFEAASLVLGPEQLVFFKVVTDHLCDALPDARKITEALEPHAEQVLDYATALHHHLQATDSPLSATDQSQLTSLAATLKLSASQRRILFEAAARWRIVQQAPLPLLHAPREPISSSQASKAALGAVLKELHIGSVP